MTSKYFFRAICRLPARADLCGGCGNMGRRIGYLRERYLPFIRSTASSRKGDLSASASSSMRLSRMALRQVARQPRSSLAGYRGEHCTVSGQLGLRASCVGIQKENDRCGVQPERPRNSYPIDGGNIPVLALIRKSRGAISTQKQVGNGEYRCGCRTLDPTTGPGGCTAIL